MNSRTTLQSLLSLATFALAGSLTLAQQPPAQPAPVAPPDASAPAPAPIERHPPMHPPMMQGRPGMHEDGRMQGGPNFAEHFRGGRPGMESRFHIGPEGMWWKNPNVVQRLTLTPEQVKRMDGIFQTSRLQLIDLKANVEKQEVMLEPLLSANPLETAKAQAQIDKVADARADLEKANAKMLLGIRGVLTPDQWTKLRDRSHGDGGPGGQGGPTPGGRPMRGHGPGNGNMSNLVEPAPEP
jgi:Spy/CpxP family protein refolding chaperone